MNRKATLRLLLPALVSIVALFAGGQGRYAKRVSAARPAPPKAVAQIPIELAGNEIFLQLRVNGSEPLWFGLDTGAGSTVVNTTTAEALGLKMEGGHSSRGAGGHVPSSTVRGVRLDIGGARLEDLAVQTIALTSIEN